MDTASDSTHVVTAALSQLLTPASTALLNLDAFLLGLSLAVTSPALALHVYQYSF